MNIVNRAVAIVIYCVAVVLVTNNGQSTDDEIIDAGDELLQLRDRVAMLELQLAAIRTSRSMFSIFRFQ